MGESAFANQLIQVLLGWLKLLADFIWSLLRGDGMGFANWFSDNWPKLLLIMLIAGVAADWIIWIARWKPHWLWFKKKRPVKREAPRPVAPKVTRPVFKSSINSEEAFFEDMSALADSAEFEEDAPEIAPQKPDARAFMRPEASEEREKASVPEPDDGGRPLTRRERRAFFNDEADGGEGE